MFTKIGKLIRDSLTYWSFDGETREIISDAKSFSTTLQKAGLAAIGQKLKDETNKNKRDYLFDIVVEKACDNDSDLTQIALSVLGEYALSPNAEEARVPGILDVLEQQTLSYSYALQYQANQSLLNYALLAQGSEDLRSQALDVVLRNADDDFFPIQDESSDEDFHNSFQAIGDLKLTAPLIDKLFEKTRSDDSEVREGAAKALGKYILTEAQDTPKIIEALLGAAGDEEEDISEASVEALSLYAEKHPEERVSILHQFDRHIAEFEASEVGAAQKQEKRTAYANALQELGNRFDMPFEGSNIVISDIMGSRDQRSAIILSPQESMASIGCQTRNLVDMAYRVVDEYGSAESQDKLKYFTDYKKLLCGAADRKPNPPKLKLSVVGAFSRANIMKDSQPS